MVNQEKKSLCGFKGCLAFGPGCTIDQTRWCPDYEINIEMINRGEIRRNGKCLNCGWKNGHGPNCPWRGVNLV